MSALARAALLIAVVVARVTLVLTRDDGGSETVIQKINIARRWPAAL